MMESVPEARCFHRSASAGWLLIPEITDRDHWSRLFYASLYACDD
jgi:hypothetical protein